MHATGWSRGLDITSGGTGVVSHAGLALLRQLSDRTGLTSGPRPGMDSVGHARTGNNRQAQRSDRRDMVLGRWVLDRHS